MEKAAQMVFAQLESQSVISFHKPWNTILLSSFTCKCTISSIQSMYKEKNSSIMDPDTRSTTCQVIFYEAFVSDFVQ